MGLIFTLSSMSNPGTPPAGISDKAAHFLVYAALGGAVVRALAGGHAASLTIGRVAMATIIVIAYGMSDEWHQAFVPERTPELMDLAADAAGGLSGAALFALAARSFGRLRRPA